MAALVAGSAAAVTGGVAASIALLKRIRQRDSTVLASKDLDISVERGLRSSDPVWEKVRQEARDTLAKEPELRTRLTNAILKQDCLEGALAHILSNALHSVNNSPKLLYKVFREILLNPTSTEGGTPLGQHIRNDLQAVVERDVACFGPLQVLIFFKGFHSIQAHRISHVLWGQDRKWMALQVQSAISENFAVDIHPAAVIGHRVMIDHATGVVIGEAAKVGDDCSLLHNVTLGASGKTAGDRHPKLGDGVLVGAGSYIIGNILIGDNAKIGCGSVVLKAIPAGATAVGAPAKVIGRTQEAKAGKEMDIGLMKERNSSTFDLYRMNHPQKPGWVTAKCLRTALKDVLGPSDVDRLFFELDVDHSGQVELEQVKAHVAEAAKKCSSFYSKCCSATSAFSGGGNCIEALMKKLCPEKVAESCVETWRAGGLNSNVAIAESNGNSATTAVGAQA